MRFVFAWLVAILSVNAWSGPLRDKVESQLAQRLATLTQVAPADPRVLRLQADLDELLVAAEEKTVSLVVTTDLLARVFPGRVVAVNADLAAAPKEQRMLVLAHEVGHVVHGDYDRYMTWATRTEEAMGFVREDAAEEQFHRQIALLRELQHDMEFEADEYASQMLVRLRLSIGAAVAVLEPFQAVGETSSHPAVRERVARLLRREDELRLQSVVY